MKMMTLKQLNELCQHSAVAHLGIEFTEIGEYHLSATVPVNEKTVQPFGLLHGGVSALLAETLASAAAMLHCAENQIPVGSELNISHLKAIKHGKATATAIPLHLGKESQVWQVEQQDEQGNLCAVSRVSVRLLVRK